MRATWHAGAAVAVVTMVAATQWAGSSYVPALDGLPDAGLATTWTAKLAALAVTVFGVRTLGETVTAAFVSPTTRDTVTRESRVRLQRTALVAAWWAFASVLAATSTLAVVLGVTLGEAVRPGVLRTYALDVAPSRNLLAVALLALAIAAICALTVALNWTFVAALLSAGCIGLPLLTSHAANLGDHSLAVTSSLLHGVAASLWLGTLWGVLPALRAHRPAEIARFQRVATVSVVVLFLSGVAAAYARLDSIGDLATTGYGRLTVLKVLLFSAVLALAAHARRTLPHTPTSVVTLEALVMAAAVGAGVALHGTAPSRAAVSLGSAAEDLLGFPYPPAPTAMTLLLGWHPDYLMLTGLLTVLTMYVWGVRRVDRWPVGRTTAFAAGVVIAVWATSGGIAKYAMVSFASHMVAHMALSMVAPILLVLGAPVTLLLRALPATSRDGSRSPRQWVSALLHSTYARLLSDPLLVLALFTVGLYGLYFTSAFSALMSSHTGHTLMGVHFLLVGLLFSYLVIGTDPQPRPLAYPLRLILVLVAMGIHGLFGVALMQQTVPVGNRWYAQVRPEWIDNPLTDTYRGGGVAWALGEIPSLMLVLAVAVMWSRSDGRLAKRLDRQADRDDDAELRAYNERLARLNKPDN